MKINKAEGSDKMQEWDIKLLNPFELDEIWYWYQQGTYDGDGSILMKKGKLWCIDSLSHCSCYGPTDHVTFDGVEKSELKNKHSQGLLSEASKLLIVAKIIKGEKNGK